MFMFYDLELGELVKMPMYFDYTMGNILSVDVCVDIRFRDLFKQFKDEVKRVLFEGYNSEQKYIIFNLSIIHCLYGEIHTTYNCIAKECETYLYCIILNCFNNSRELKNISYEDKAILLCIVIFFYIYRRWSVPLKIIEENIFEYLNISYNIINRYMGKMWNVTTNKDKLCLNSIVVDV